MDDKFEKHAEIKKEDAALVARMVKGRTREKVGKRTITHLTPDAWEAKVELIEKHTSFVKTRVKRHAHIGDTPLEDRIVYGLSGFWQSLDTVDTSNSNTLLKHSERFIKTAINDAIRLDFGAITLASKTLELSQRINKISDKLSTEWHKATPAEIAQHIKDNANPERKGLPTKERVHQTLYATYINNTSLSRDEAYNPDTKTSMQFGTASKSEEPEHACIETEEAQKRYEQHEQFWDALHSLDDRAQEIIIERYLYDNGKPIGQKELGAKFGLSKQRVHVIEKASLKQIGQYIKEEHTTSEPE